MNFSALLGIAAALAVFLGSTLSATSSREIFLDPHGILVVVGGTIAASLLCFPASTFPQMVKVIFKRVLSKKVDHYDQVIKEIVFLATAQQEDPDALRERSGQIKHPFLREAVQLHVTGGLTPEKLDAILRKRASMTAQRYNKDAGIFKIMSRFPPAFGLMGTTIGMIALLQSLGSPDAYKKLGPAMAIGLVATLYGIAIANLVLIPLGENLTKMNEEGIILREIVIDGIKMLRAQEHPLVVEEYLKSYLSPGERNKVLKAA